GSGAESGTSSSNASGASSGSRSVAGSGTSSGNASGSTAEVGLPDAAVLEAGPDASVLDDSGTHCTNDTDCPGSACGTQICSWTANPNMRECIDAGSGTPGME